MEDRGKFDVMLGWTHAAACIMKTMFSLLVSIYLRAAGYQRTGDYWTDSKCFLLPLGRVDLGERHQ